jgi:hypothetical protein
MIELMVLSSAEKIIIEVVLVKVGQKVVYWRVEVGARSRPSAYAVLLRRVPRPAEAAPSAVKNWYR